MRRSVQLFEEDNSPTERLARFLTDIGIPGNDLAGIDAELQRRFFQKKPGTNEPLERWELKEVEVGCPATKILEHLSGLGFTDRTYPRQGTYEYAGWPGAKPVRSGARLLDLIDAWNAGTRWNQLVAFTGSRPLDADETFEACAKAVLGDDIERTPGGDEPRWIWEQMSPKTEAQMMEFQWTIAPKPIDMTAPLDALFIDAPMKPNPKPEGKPIRPNSEDPVHLWLKRYLPAPGTMLFSSGAPYGMAQDEAMWMILGPLGFEIDTFGHVAPQTLGVEALMREVAGTVNRIKRARIAA